jgi:hypothetical protein
LEGAAEVAVGEEAEEMVVGVGDEEAAAPFGRELVEGVKEAVCGAAEGERVFFEHEILCFEGNSPADEAARVVADEVGEGDLFRAEEGNGEEIAEKKLHGCRGCGREIVGAKLPFDGESEGEVGEMGEARAVVGDDGDSLGSARSDVGDEFDEFLRLAALAIGEEEIGACHEAEVAVNGFHRVEKECADAHREEGGDDFFRYVAAFSDAGEDESPLAFLQDFEKGFDRFDGEMAVIVVEIALLLFEKFANHRINS